MFLRGHIADCAEEVAKRRKLFPWIGTSGLPLSTNNRAKLPESEGGPGILNQGPTSSCEGHAHASGATLRLALAGTPVPLLSPIGLYQGALMEDRGTGPQLALLQDNGTMPSSIQRAWTRWGACSAVDWGSYPADPVTICNEPSPEQLLLERRCRFYGAYFIQSSGDQKAYDVMAALARGYPITNAIPASGPEFQNYSSGILGALSGPIDHANLVVDYSWDGTKLSTLRLYCINSWGRLWGMAGQYVSDYDYLQQMEDSCVLDISRV